MSPFLLLLAVDIVMSRAVDGTYHVWSAGENFTRVADFYGVSPQAIVTWPGNPLDAYAFDVNNPNIAPGTWLIILYIFIALSDLLDGPLARRGEAAVKP